MKKILFIGTGGTIAAEPTAEGLSPELSAQRLIDGVDLSELSVTAVQLFSLDSTNLTPEHWVRLALLIRDEWDGYDGFVIAHGTDTMAYGAAALSCLIRNSAKPIILTGSQLPLTALGSDAPRNLSDAFRCAAFGRGGVWVCFCGRVIAGNAARKAHTVNSDAFRGFTGESEMSVESFISAENACNEDGTVFYNRLDSGVAVLKLTPGILPQAVQEFGLHFKALVIEGFGLGGIPDEGTHELFTAVKSLIDCGVRVIMTTQVFAGGCDLTVYKVGQSAIKAGVIPAGGITTEYAVMRAMWALAYSSSQQDFRELFLADLP